MTSAAATPTSLAGYWDELVTAALLGTDRRPPPPAPPGPLADLVADAVLADPSQRMLTAVAACAAARRAGITALPPAAVLAPPAADARPLCPAAASLTWRYLAGAWPVLEDEWLLAAIDNGWRLAPDVVVALLGRHRGDAVRRARVAIAAGPIAGWLVEHIPALAPTSRAIAAPAEVRALPQLAVPPQMAPLLAADAPAVVATLLPDFDAGHFGPAHRAVLVNLLARCRPDVLGDVAAGLEQVDAMSPSAGLALSLADLARTRQRMLDELVAPPG